MLPPDIGTKVAPGMWSATYCPCERMMNGLSVTWSTKVGLCTKGRNGRTSMLLKKYRIRAAAVLGVANVRFIRAAALRNSRSCACVGFVAVMNASLPQVDVIMS